MAQMTMTVCDFCPQNKKMQALATCSICGKDVCAEHGMGHSVVFKVGKQMVECKNDDFKIMCPVCKARFDSHVAANRELLTTQAMKAANALIEPLKEMMQKERRVDV